MVESDFEEIIYRIIKSPEHGVEFYNKEMFSLLVEKVKYLYKELGLAN